MKTINMTPQIGFAIKKLRTQFNKTAKEVSEAESINKTRSYFSKLEKGDVKKIDVDLFITILNIITDSTDGLRIFLDNAADDFDSFDDASKIIFMNLDDIICQLQIDTKFIEYVKKLITDNSLNTHEICNKINQNSEISDSADLSKLPTNIWTSLSGKYKDCIIKLHYEDEFINSILSGSVKSTNYITLLSLLYAIYQIIDSENKNIKRDAVLLITDFGMGNSRINHKRKTIELDKDFAVLSPSTIELYQSIMTQIKLMLVLNEEYSAKRLSALDHNLEIDLGFTFAYMTPDLSDIIGLTKDTKQKFLYDLKDLIKKYSTPEQQSLELYLDE